MTITETGRLRPRLVKIAAGAAVAGTACGLLGTGVAHAQVDPPLNVLITDTPGPVVRGPAINIDWDAPTTGDPVTFYRLEIDRLNDGSIDFTTYLPSSQTEYRGYAATPATLYRADVYSNDGVYTSLVPGSDTHTTPAGPPVECATSPWDPFCTVDAFVNQQYRDWQDRLPSLDERNFWRFQLQTATGDPVVDQVAYFLDEFRRNDDVKAGPVIRLYTAYFLRNPDLGGYRFWLEAVTNGGWSMGQVAEFFASSPEFQAMYGSLDNAEFVALLYQNVLFRQPDAGGFAFWTRQLDAGNSRGWLMQQFAEAPSGELIRRTQASVATTEIYAEMLNRMPTLAEYAAARFIIGDDPAPLDAARTAGIFDVVLSSDEYRDRITPR